MEQLDAINLAERLRWEQEQQEYWLHLEAASPLEKYPAKQHAKSVQHLLGVPDGLIYLAGEPRRNNEDSDMPAPFRQRRYFYYLSGVNERGCHLVYNINTSTLALFIPRVDRARVIYDGRGSTPAEALDKYDIDQVYFSDELEDFLLEWLKFYKGPLYLLHASQNPLSEPVDEPVDSSTLQLAMNAARIIKDEHEIKQIRKANDISSQAHKEVLANVLRFKNEAQVEGLFRDVCISRFAKEQAYDPIAASGPNAGTLHYGSNNEDFGDRQLMCLDAACEWDLYAADITRTFPLSGSWPSQECKEIYHLVQRMQDSCIDRVKPGMRYLDLHIIAHQVAIAGLLHLGILHNGTAEEIFKAGTSRAFFPHGLGHHIGLEVHDVGQGELMSMTKFGWKQHRSLYPDNFHLPVYSSETCRAPCDPKSPHLEEGMVVTIEPGIYFNTYLLNTKYLQDPVHSKFINTHVVQRYLPVGGVRIEDDILVTSKGYENLTTAPKGEAMMEIIRSQNVHWPFVSKSADLGPVPSNVTAQHDSSEHRPKPALKSSTLPARLSSFKSKTKADQRKSVDFETFNGPSLYAGFPSTSTTDENVQRWRLSRRTSMVRCQSPESIAPRSKESIQPRTPVCGEDSPTVVHAYVDFPVAAKKSSVSVRSYTAEEKPSCHKCTVLVQTLDRLRQNLSSRDHETKPSVQPASSRAPEMTERPRVTRTMPILPSQVSAAPGKDTLKEKIQTLEEKIGMLEKKINSTEPDKKGLPYRQSLPNLQAHGEPSTSRGAPLQTTKNGRPSRQSWSQALSRGSDIRTEQLQGLARSNTGPVRSNPLTAEAQSRFVPPPRTNSYQDQLRELEAKNKERLLRHRESQGRLPNPTQIQTPATQTIGPIATTLDGLVKQTAELVRRSEERVNRNPDHRDQQRLPVSKPDFSYHLPTAPQEWGKFPELFVPSNAQSTQVDLENKCERCRIMDMPCSGNTPCHFCSKLQLPCEPSTTVRKPAPPQSSSTASDHDSTTPPWSWSHNGLQSRHVAEPKANARLLHYEKELKLLEQQNKRRMERMTAEQDPKRAAYLVDPTRAYPTAASTYTFSNAHPSVQMRLCQTCDTYGCTSHPNTQPFSSRSAPHDSSLDGLTDAMDRLWDVRQDLQSMGGAAWGDERRESRQQWRERVEGDVRSAIHRG